MTLQEAIEKATKLLALSKSDNPHEAALAAQRAQEILTRYDIDLSALNAERGSDEPEEEIENFTSRAPLDVADSSRLSNWKSTLASTIARANQARVYKSGNAIGIVGRPSDVEKVRYLYDMLVRDVDRLTDANGKGCGRTWRNQFRYGVVDAIGSKLADTQAKVAADMRAENTGTALVRVNQAIEKVQARGKAVDTWLANNMRLRTSKVYHRGNFSAREAGREAGKSLNISGARGALGASNKQIKGS